MKDHFGNNLLSSDLNFARGIHVLDDCEGTCKWSKSSTDANATVTYETAAAWTGTYGLQLFSGDADPAEDDFVQAAKYSGLSRQGIICFRGRFSSPDPTKIKYLSIWMSLSNGLNTYWAQFRYYPNTPKLVYVDSAGAEQIISGFDFTITGLNWFDIELVVDTLAMQYKYVIVNGQYITLAGIDLEDSGATTAKLTGLCIKATTIGASACKLYADAIYAGEYENV